MRFCVCICEEVGDENPFFSVIVPTRNRPEYIHDCIASVINQVFMDFEIIVSDNSIDRPCLDIITNFEDKRIKYKKPEKALGVCDNFEFARRCACGKYILVLGDKQRLYKDALKKIYEILSEEDADIVSFNMEMFSLFDSKNDGNGRNV